MAEVAIPPNLFAEILRFIAELRPPAATSTAEGVRFMRSGQTHWGRASV